MRVQRFLWQVCLTLLCVAALVMPLSAQNNKATVLGVVTDPQGALVRGANITVTNQATGEKRLITTGEDGSYAVGGLQPGDYKLTVEASGFKTVTYNNVVLETNARQAFDAVFTEVAGTGSNEVTVTADAGPLTESETSVRGDIITGREVTDDKNYDSFAEVAKMLVQLREAIAATEPIAAPKPSK